MSPILGIWASAQQLAYAGAYESIATVTVGSGGSSSISFSSIPSTYKHLQIRYISRNASVTDTTLIRFNSDSSANYAYHQIRGSGSAATSVAFTSATYIEAPYTSYSGITANIFGGGIIDILDYANTNKYKTVRSLGGADLNGSGYIFFNSGLWQNTNAITSIVFSPSTGNFEQYSTFALYGIKG